MTRTYFNGRSQRVRDHLAAHPQGSTLRQLIAATEPGCPYNRMSATVATLCKRGKARAERKPRASLYYPTPTTLTDARPAANAASGKKRRNPNPRRRPTTNTAHTQRPTGKRKPAPAARAPFHIPPPATARRPTGQAETVDQFLARGGHIQRLPRHASATPLYSSVQDLNAASMRHRLAHLPDQD